MFIQTEHTPNPATIKFIPGKAVLDDGTVDYRSKSEAAGSPLGRSRMAAQQAGHPRRHHGALHVRGTRG